MSLKSYHVKRFNPSVKRFTVSTALLWFQGGYNTPGTYMCIINLLQHRGGTVGCYLRELNIDELAGPIPEYVAHVLNGLEPHDPKNLLCRTEAQISASLSHSFPSQLRSFSFAILQKWLNIPPNIITTCVQNTPFWGIFQKKFSGWRDDSVTPSYLREGTKMEQKLLLWHST